MATEPMTAKANEDTTSYRRHSAGSPAQCYRFLVEFRLFIQCLSLWFFFRCLSHLRSARTNGTKPSRGQSSDGPFARLPTQNQLRSWAYMVNAWLSFQPPAMAHQPLTIA